MRYRFAVLAPLVLLTFGAYFIGTFGRFDGAWSDTLIRWLAPETLSPEFVVVEVDEKAEAAWTEPMALWGGHFADVVNRAHELGAKRVVLDYSLEADADRALNEFAERIAPGDLKVRGRVDDSLPNVALQIAIQEHPETVLGAADRSALAPVFRDNDSNHIGSVQRPDTVDGMAREAYLKAPDGLPSLAAAAIGKGEDTAAGTRFVVGFAKTVNPISVGAMLDKEHPIDLAGKTVFVGTSVSDHLDTPVAMDTPGVHFQAQTADALAHGRVYRNAPAMVVLLLLLVTSGTLTALWRPTLGRSMGYFLGLVLITLLASAVLAFGAKVILPVAATLALLGVSAMTQVAFDLVDSRLRALEKEVERSRLEGTLSAMISPQLLSHLLQNPKIADRSGQEARVVCIILDIRNSVLRGQQLGGTEYMRLLNIFFESTLEVIERHGGFVSRFTGDGFLAIFGYPERTTNTLAEAFLSCKDLVESVDRFNASYSPVDPWRIGIGLHDGDCLFGGVGREERWELTVIGPAVNIAARLESLTKDYEASILVTEEIQQALGTLGAELLCFGETRIKGLANSVSVFGLKQEADT